MKPVNKFCLACVVAFGTLTGYSQELLPPEDNSIGTSLTEQWELDSAYQNGTFIIRSYKPIFVTAGRWSSDPNRQPMSENPDYSLSEPIDYNKYEAKFQLSFKTKVFQNIFWGMGDLWAAYTQKAYWQIYNKSLSRAFRELNYEPELILNFPLNINVSGIGIKMIGISFDHQSNGRSQPRSRSWNRIIFHAGFERKNWQVVLRPWIRVEDPEDENPEITNYIGRGEANITYNFDRSQIYLVVTHTLRFGKNNRGSAQFNWVYQLKGNLRIHAEIFTGYGETLIDYNHRQTTMGLGVSFNNW